MNTLATEPKTKKNQTKKADELKVPLYDISGKKLKDISLPVEIFGVEWNSDLVHQVMRVKLANSRKVLAHTKARGEVRGGGIKPWRQKGTGRARHGSIRSPIWVGGGVTFGPTKERNYGLKINKKMNRKALFMVLSRKLHDEEVIFVQDFKLEQPKTKELNGILNKLPVGNHKVMVVLSRPSEEISRAVGNLKKIKLCMISSINLLDLLNYRYLLLMESGIDALKGVFSDKEKEEKGKK